MDKQTLEELINSNYDHDRMIPAYECYKLERLISDESPDVRKIVAGWGYRLDILINDRDENVRAAVAEMGYALDVLINDPSERVRRQAQRTLRAKEKGKFKEEYHFGSPTARILEEIELRDDITITVTNENVITETPYNPQYVEFCRECKAKYLGDKRWMLKNLSKEDILAKLKEFYKI